jgi:hypothetical protein
VPSIGDLYRSIDWSQADGALARWEAQHRSPEETDNASFRYRWRCALLESALYATDETRQREARGWLAMAGVWPQVVAYFQANCLI